MCTREGAAGQGKAANLKDLKTWHRRGLLHTMNTFLDMCAQYNGSAFLNLGQDSCNFDLKIFGVVE